MRYKNLHELALERFLAQIDEKLIDLIEREFLEYVEDIAPHRRAEIFDALARRLATRAEVLRA